MDIATTPLEILLIQASILILSSTDIPAAPVIYSHFPILQRFRCTVFIYAISRLIMYSVGSFGLVYLVNILGNWGIFPPFRREKNDHKRIKLHGQKRG